MPIHPLTVHFPIAFLLLAGILFTIELFTRQTTHKTFAWITLLAGVAGAALAVVTGNMAMNGLVVNETIGETVEQHELLAYLVLWLFGIFAVWGFLRRNATVKAERIAFVLLFWLGIGLVAYTAHLGGTLVYELGAGVLPMESVIESGK